MNELLQESVYFGVAVSLFAYWVGIKCRKKWDIPVMNPLLIAMVLLIVVFLGTGISYETYSYGAKYLTYFLTPATVCLAVPLYRQVKVLKKNLPAVFLSIGCGCLAHAVTIVGLSIVLRLEDEILLSFMPKSVTTAIALGVSEEIGGIQSLTVVGVCVAGMMGAILGPALLKWLHVTQPEAQGLALGTASHAIGTSKAVELGEVQGAMSSLAIVVTGILTVILLPFLVKYL